MADPVLLPAPCWWVDRDDPWEISHWPTAEAAETAHLDDVRAEYGWPLSAAGALAIRPGVTRQETYRCWSTECVQCGTDTHGREPATSCLDCGDDLPSQTPRPVDDPNQAALFNPTEVRSA